MVLYRITKKKYVRDSSGEGARRVGGRWNSPGHPMLYTADSVALSALEYLVHVRQMSVIPENLVVAAIEISDDLVLTPSAEQLPSDWMNSPYGRDGRHFGDSWLSGRKSLALRVPSVMLPVGEGWNYLINPAHSEIHSVNISERAPFTFDARLFPQALDLPDRNALVRILEKGDAQPELKNKILALFR